MDTECNSWIIESTKRTITMNEESQENNRSNSSSSHSHRSQDSGFSDSELHVTEQKSSPTTSEKNLLTSLKEKSSTTKDSIFSNFQRNDISRISCIPAPFNYQQAKKHNQIKTNPHLITCIPYTSTPKPQSNLLSKTNLEPSLKAWLTDLIDSFENEITVNLQSTPIFSRLLQEVNKRSDKLINSIQSLIKHMNSIQEMFDSNRTNDSLVTLKQLIGNITEFVLIINLTSDRTIIDRKKRDKLLEACDTLIKETENRKLNNNDVFPFLKLALKDMSIVYNAIAAEAIKFHIQELLDKLESSDCHLLTRAILNTFMILMLQQYEYQTTSALIIDKIVETHAPRAFLTICIECKASTIRTLALRCLTIVCSNAQAIQQLELCGGMEILADILTECGRPEPELSEAAAVLVQITATWLPFETRINSIEQKLCTSLITSITRFVQTTNCCQNLLLCIAALANLTEIEPEFAIPILVQFRSIEKVLNSLRNHRKPKISLFLKEQTVLLILHSSQLPDYRNKLVSEPLLLVALFSFLQQPINFDNSHCTNSFQNSNENAIFVQQKIHYRAALALNRLCLESKVVQKLIQIDGISRLIVICNNHDLDDTTQKICLDILKTVSNQCYQLPLDTQLSIQTLLRNLKT